VWSDKARAVEANREISNWLAEESLEKALTESYTCKTQAFLQT